jgi:hypothetical protein
MESAEEKRRSNLWYATTYIDEYFRLLGGAGCYTGYCDRHVPALVTLAMDEWVGNLPIPYEYAVKDLIDYQMWTQTDQLPAKALEHVGKYEPTLEDIDWFTARVTERYPMTYNPFDNEEWQRFLERRLKLLNSHS